MTQIDPRLAIAANDVIELISRGVDELKQTPQEKWVDRHVKALEIYNKMISVCMTRKIGDEKNPLAELSDDELEGSF